MTDTPTPPERIWAKPCDAYGIKWGDGSWTDCEQPEGHGYTLYTRADLATYEQGVADGRRQALEAGATVPDAITQRMMEHAASLGRADWGATAALDAEGHADHVKTSVRITADVFGQTGPQAMHGLYVEGTETVLAHTGTSPNSPNTARILTALWNRFVDEAEALTLTEQETET